VTREQVPAADAGQNASRAQAIGLCDQGVAHHQAGRLAEAESCYRGALAIDASHADSLHNLGRVLEDLDRLEEAAQAYHNAAAVQPDCAELHNRLGNVLQKQGRLDAAMACYRRVITLDPGFARAYSNLAAALYRTGAVQEAITCFQRAVDIDPQFAAGYYNFGTLLGATGRLEEARACYARAYALQPGNDKAFCELVFIKRMLCDWSSNPAEELRLLELIRSPAAMVSPFIALNVDSSPADQLRCTSRWMARLSVPQHERFTHSVMVPRSGDKLRVGYVSADFYGHATVYLIAEMLERHDRARFEIHGYSCGPDDKSESRRRAVAAFDHFVDVRDLSHLDAARLIKRHGIDILVDLKGFTQGARTEIFTYRPAPLQVNYLGYPGTMGSDVIDYLIADRFVVPPDQQKFYAEKLVYLPHCYQPNDTHRRAAQATPSRAACGLPQEGFVFCCFNNGFKLTPAVFDIWARLLAATSGSVLWLLEDNPGMSANLRREIAARGIAPERLVFAPRQPNAEHLARHRLADLFLDTQPYNAHTTASDALWMGVPVVTCAGASFAGRVAGSLLHAVGLPELVTETAEGYEALARDLACDPARLGEIRRRLASHRATAPLFDIAAYTSAIDEAYLRMQAIRQAGEPARSFAIGEPL
jgi:protein O-GlcNAc transferase